MLLNGPWCFFYPAAMTKGCTKESCHFAIWPRSSQHSAVSDWASPWTVLRSRPSFTTERLDYRCRRRERDVARLYGVKRSLDLLKVKRATFVIGQDRRIAESSTVS